MGDALPERIADAVSSADELRGGLAQQAQRTQPEHAKAPGVPGPCTPPNGTARNEIARPADKERDRDQSDSSAHAASQRGRRARLMGGGVSAWQIRLHDCLPAPSGLQNTEIACEGRGSLPPRTSSGASRCSTARPLPATEELLRRQADILGDLAEQGGRDVAARMKGNRRAAPIRVPVLLVGATPANLDEPEGQ